MPAWTPAPYALPYIAPDDVIEQTPATNKAQMEKVSEYLAQVAGSTPIGTIVPWSLPYAETGGSVYSNVARFAPMHLPATGGVYANSVAPLLADAIGHTFVDADPDVGDDGDLISGKSLNMHHGVGYDNSAIYRRDGDDGPPVLVLADAFCTPDLRGRSPVGSHDIPNDPVLGPMTYLGERQGDWRTKGHRHAVVPHGHANFPGTGSGYNTGTINEWRWSSGDPMVTSSTNQNGNTKPHGVRRTNVTEAQGTGPDDPVLVMTAYEYSAYMNEDLAAHGSAHQDPQTVVNWLIFAGGPVSDPTPVTGTGGARSGEPVRLHPVTSADMFRKRLSDPNLTDESREILEELLGQ